MSAGSRRGSRGALIHLSILAIFKALVSALTLATGFRALSDDDYARIVIAERFAAAPSLDPSGTSWLPFPFWVYGSTLALFGRSVESARALAFVLGILSVLGVYGAARWLGLSARAALLGALFSAVFPYSAWLGVAAVPEVPTAALVLIGIASLSQTGFRRALGALALSLACLSRYEAWPVALIFIFFTALDAVRGRKVRNAYPAIIAIAGPVFWLMNGIAAHGDALFFIKRVSEYRRAIGITSSGIADALLGYPLLILRAEPELVTLFLVSLAVLLVSRSSSALARHTRGLAAIAAIVAFLIAGELRDGAPTHHAERAVLAVWFWLAVVSADALASALPKLSTSARAAAIAALGLSIAPAAGIFRPWYAHRDSFVDRSAEIELGARARSLANSDARLLIDTPDYAFWAVIAGFGAPERAAPFDDRDPRKARAADPFVSNEALSARVRKENAALIVVGAEHRERARAVGTVEYERGSLLLARVIR